MTGLPVFFWTGALDRSMLFLMRSSCCFFCEAIFSSLTRSLLSFSFSFSAFSTSSWGIISMLVKYSSSLASMFASIISVPREESGSKAHFSYTSPTLLLSWCKSSSMSCSSAWPLRGLARSRRAEALASSSEMLCLRVLIWYCSCSVSSSILLLVTSSFCLSSSSCSSVSWLFWIRNRFLSSKAAKMSRSCCGLLKNILHSQGFPSSGSHRSSSRSSRSRSLAR
mmetsp:Transcript_10916/g.28364  ORF Transcript_10916/g.28364 Transcript_10916/m.28364 type:complete len:224 (-) Transcript_10916:1043-1714(-)